MLGFGLTLLGGCVATTETGQPDTLYFPVHSVFVDKASSTIDFTPPIPPSEQAMAASAHCGVFIAENIIKSGNRSGGTHWGVVGDTEKKYFSGNNGVYHNTITLNLTSKNSSTSTSYCTNVCWTPSHLPWSEVGNVPSLYTSGAGLTSPRFEFQLANGAFYITDSLNGSEQTTQVTLNDDVSFSETPVRVYIWRTVDQIQYDFVVSSYVNDFLGACVLTSPMRALPASFADGGMAVFEYQTQQLIEYDL